MTLEISIAEQLWCCLFSLIFGVASGILFDFFKMFGLLAGIAPTARNPQRLKVVRVALAFIIDFIFCVAVSIAFSVLMYAFSYGRTRLVYLLCTGIGAVAYFKTLGRLVAPLLQKTVTLLKLAVRYIFKIVLAPIKLLLRSVLKGLYLVYKKTVFILFCKISLHADRKRADRLAETKMRDSIRL